MFESPWRSIVIGALVLIVVCGIGAGFLFYTSISNTALAQPSAPVEGSDLAQTGPESSAADTIPPASTAAPTHATGGGAQSPENLTTQLESIGAALDTYNGEFQKYPDSLTTLKAQNPDLSIAPSFSYETDGPSDDIYSLCVLTDNSLTYECLSSELGGNDPFTFPSASMETYDLSRWQALGWQFATSTKSAIVMSYPPDWTYSTSTYAGNLTGQDAQGNSIVIGRFNIFNWQMSPSQTFSQFEQANAAASTAQVASSSAGTVNGFPVYELTGEASLRIFCPVGDGA